MNLSRRTFLRNAALTAAGATLLQQNLFANAKKGELTGIQLYSSSHIETAFCYGL
jgi:hypothetical protein